MLKALHDLGLGVKLSLEPGTTKLFAGYITNTDNDDGIVHLPIPRQRITRFRLDIRLCQKRGGCSARRFVSIVGSPWLK